MMRPTSGCLDLDPGGSVGARPRERFLALDSLRGICAICVALFHFETIGAIHNSALVLHSYLFVDFFFVLSGFVIAASYGDRLGRDFPIGRFMLLRLGRLYPLHFFMLLCFLAMQLIGSIGAPSIPDHAFFTGESSMAELMFGLFFVQIFVGAEDTWYNGPSWSIAAEMWAYLVAAALFRLARGRVAAAAAALSTLGFIAYVVTLRVGFSTHHWGALPRCLFSFGLGVFTFRAYVALRERIGVRFSLLKITSVEAMAAVAAFLLVAFNYSLLGPFAFATLVLTFAFQGGWLSRLLVTRPMLLLGTLSYSIYMVHDFIEARLMNLLTLAGRSLGRPDLILFHDHAPVIGGSPVVADIVTVVTVLIVIGVAWCSYRLIERPGQRWSRRFALGTNGARTIGEEERAPTF